MIHSSLSTPPPPTHSTRDKKDPPQFHRWRYIWWRPLWLVLQLSWRLYFGQLNTIVFDFGPITAILLCLFLALCYVGSLYIWTSGSQMWVTSKMWKVQLWQMKLYPCCIIAHWLCTSFIIRSPPNWAADLTGPPIDYTYIHIARAAHGATRHALHALYVYIYIYIYIYIFIYIYNIDIYNMYIYTIHQAWLVD